MLKIKINLIFSFILFTLLLLKLTSLSLAQTQAQTKLLIQNQEGQNVLTRSLAEDQCFGLRFIHSVAKSPVEEWFCVRNGQLFLEKTVYCDFGAGLPFQPEPGQKMSFSHGKIILEGLKQKLPNFDVRVGRIAKHTLLWPRQDEKYEEIPLVNLGPQGSALHFSLSQTKPKAQNKTD